MFFLCAESAAIDRVRNSLSVFHILESIQAQSFPAIVPRVTVLGSLAREPNDPESLEYTLAIRIGDRPLFSGPIKIAFIQQLTARMIAELQGVAIPTPGDLVFSLLDATEELATWKVSVIGGYSPPVQLSFGPSWRGQEFLADTPPQNPEFHAAQPNT
jgi:hypothetical protein